jgi:pyrroloquinoline-quinone synthase
MILDVLDALVAKHDLNQHPFYQAWRAGTLPRAALAAYAVEYAPFIESVAGGWKTLGEGAHAEEELAHARLWNEFREGLAASGEPSCDAALELAREALRLFAAPASATGALYAFEAQQPSTARSKLDGLREHYGVTGRPAAYFAAHADDYGERSLLRERAATLTEDEAPAAVKACERMCLAMWDALSGILASTGGSHAACA